MERELTPVEIAAAGTGVALATGRNHALLLKDDGSLISWGANNYGQLGNGGGHGLGDQACCVTVGLPIPVLQIDAGGTSSYALLTDGSLYAWGWNHYGEVGDGGGFMMQHTSPVHVPSLPPSLAYQIGGGGYSITIVVLLPDGSAVGSGRNTNGQLATGDTSWTLCQATGLCRTQYSSSENTAAAGPLPGLGEGNIATARGDGFMLLLRRP